MIPGPTGERCLLCGRGPANGNGNGNSNDYEPDPLFVALMAAPPGAAVSYRSQISEEQYERPGFGRGRKWLPWAGADLAYERLPTSGRGHAGRGGERAGEIRDLHEGGLGLAEIIAEGQRRLDAGLLGWKANYARDVLRRQRLREAAL